MSEYTGYSQTSLLAYKSIETKLGEKQQEVLEAIKHLGVCDNKQIAKHLGWEINRVTGRVNELRKKNFIKLALKAHNAEGRLVQYYQVNKDERNGE